jgi:hypothetical protein
MAYGEPDLETALSRAAVRERLQSIGPDALRLPAPPLPFRFTRCMRFSAISYDRVFETDARRNGAEPGAQGKIPNILNFASGNSSIAVALSEEPSHSQPGVHIVQPQVRQVHAGAEEVEATNFDAQRDRPGKEPSHSAGRPQVIDQHRAGHRFADPTSKSWPGNQFQKPQTPGNPGVFASP